ncbi:MAG: hypothetical protein CM15mP51_24790 [Porticoccaceae bacterium]|nr:MAG: hypothetical protein CM15mP51_24790 [Porticoccaceae bacterium]
MRRPKNAFRDVGLDIEIQNVGIYKLGEDGNLNASAALQAARDRTGIFAGLNEMVTRQPDLFIHYSTRAVADTGGLASINGGINDGVINYNNLYSNGNNFGIVSIDNGTLTLVHEIGHLMGLSHSRRQAVSAISATFPWAVGTAKIKILRQSWPMKLHSMMQWGCVFYTRSILWVPVIQKHLVVFLMQTY